ncbi:LOW QUALITY PROTEIN: uncharacterized protein MICPUCDRAFT_67550 [Micromonas pusilla CCMP1545]|uniref:Predicted protein n=1 Tax=Micromonas pusilla (strain CCMP1545) TaxID=564608 RepID=C1MR12_MICPC|nr:LOW QUALITY PROTEIN: uncharacterized protein MICPUCDRAFT_67550 [Micromonas pusilla CCMP1545]EEH57798.1 predicted protein [Micromonas pusilla CCMP1545]|eukprot:XP_003057847.1 predicted protein [Micromonas pusilla CCMP1545]
MGLAHQAGLPFAQQYLKLSATDMQRYGIVAYFPWSLKPVFGMLSDVVPIAGTTSGITRWCSSTSKSPSWTCSRKGSTRRRCGSSRR